MSGRRAAYLWRCRLISSDLHRLTDPAAPELASGSIISSEICEIMFQSFNLFYLASTGDEVVLESEVIVGVQRTCIVKKELVGRRFVSSSQYLLNFTTIRLLGRSIKTQSIKLNKKRVCDKCTLKTVVLAVMATVSLMLPSPINRGYHEKQTTGT